MVVYATDNETLIGFGCAIPFNRSPNDVREFLGSLSKDGRLPRLTTRAPGICPN